MGDKKRIICKDHNYKIPLISKCLMFNTIMDFSVDSLYFKDKDFRFICVNKNKATRHGIKNPAEMIGKTDFDFISESTAKEICEDEKSILETGHPVIGKIEKLIRLDGSATWSSSSKYPFYDKKGKIIGIWGISRDITENELAKGEIKRVNAELIEVNRKLEILSSKDSLTDLYNHRFFYKEVQREFLLQKRRKEEGVNTDFSIIIFDIDFFKKINDSGGHLTGDFILRHVADIMKKSVRASDEVFRYGGDEFVILLPDTPKARAKIVAEKIRKSIKKSPVCYCERNYGITISAGISSASEVNDVNELIDSSDRRLYTSKSCGRDMVTTDD